MELNQKVRYALMGLTVLSTVIVATHGLHVSMPGHVNEPGGRAD